MSFTILQQALDAQPDLELAVLVGSRAAGRTWRELEAYEWETQHAA